MDGPGVSKHGLDIGLQLDASRGNSATRAPTSIDVVVASNLHKLCAHDNPLLTGRASRVRDYGVSRRKKIVEALGRITLQERGTVPGVTR